MNPTQSKREISYASDTLVTHWKVREPISSRATPNKQQPEYLRFHVRQDLRLAEDVPKTPVDAGEFSP